MAHAGVGPHARKRSIKSSFRRNGVLCQSDHYFDHDLSDGSCHFGLFFLRVTSRVFFHLPHALFSFPSRLAFGGHLLYRNHGPARTIRSLPFLSGVFFQSSVASSKDASACAWSSVTCDHRSCPALRDQQTSCGPFFTRMSRWGARVIGLCRSFMVRMLLRASRRSMARIWCAEHIQRWSSR